jgi:hypothetical protein
MRKTILLGIAAIVLGSAPNSWAQSDDAVGPDMLSWARLQGRVSLSTPVSNLRTPSWSDSSLATPRINSLSLMGDYYLGGASSPLNLSGFRATSGLMLGTRTPLWGNAALGTSGVERRWANPEQGTESSATTPYLGLGYTSLSSRSGWRFSADVGLMSLQPGNILRLGRVLNGGDNFDDMLRALRFSQVLQVGLSYAF